MSDLPLRASAIRVSYESQGFEVTYLVTTDLPGLRLLWKILRSACPATTCTHVLRDLVNAGSTGMAGLTFDSPRGYAPITFTVA